MIRKYKYYYHQNRGSLFFSAKSQLMIVGLQIKLKISESAFFNFNYILKHTLKIKNRKHLKLPINI